MSAERARGAGTVYLGLGSNLGDREAHLRAALAALDRRPDCRVLRVSTLRATAPVGGPPQGDYLNGAAELETSLPPRRLLAVLKDLERAAGRAHAPQRDSPRPLDLDILLFGRRRLSIPDLTIPHPRLLERSFALDPLAELGMVPPFPQGESMAVLDAPSAMADFAARALAEGRSIGFVPTMGALHAGHESLVSQSLADHHATVVSLFVNPLQFGPSEDFHRYPRDLPRDRALLEGMGVDVLFAPSAADLYPEGFSTRIDVGPLGAVLEGAARPGHFSGVAVVVLKLLQLVRPSRAYFGRKDAQQLAVVRRIVEDLCVPVEIVGCPTIRDPDGLALSSRNAYLSPAERRRAAAIPRALSTAARAHAAGERRRAALMDAARRVLAEEPGVAVEYLEVREEATFLVPEDPVETGLVLVAARVGATRLIDNVPLSGGTGGAPA